MHKEGTIFVVISVFLFLQVVLCTGLCLAEELQFEESIKLVALVDDAVALVTEKGEAAFNLFVEEGSRWRHGEIYIFVLGLDGTFVVHPDPQLRGKNQMNLSDVDGKPIVKSLIAKAKESGEKGGAWLHYLWAKPGEISPTWKTTYLRIAMTPSGKEFVIGCGLYNMRMEKAFAVEEVNGAARLIQKEGKTAFAILRDKKSEYNYKDTYIFVFDGKGNLLVDPPFPSLEGRNLYGFKDAAGKSLVREFIDVANSKGSGWVEYLAPKPDECTPLKKNSFVRKVETGNEVFIIGTGIYADESTGS